jgi:hypothetical protein
MFPLSKKINSKKYLNLLKKLFVTSTFVGIMLSSLSLSSFAQSSGGIGVLPSTKNPSNPQTKDWFIETAKPGEKIKRSAIISNFFSDEKEIQIRAKDNVQTKDGGWNFKNNNAADEFLGKWISLETDKIKVAGGKSNDAKSGEYGGVIAAQLPPIPNNQGVAIENRIGSRIYLTVPGDLKMATKMDNFEFLTPKSQNYSQLSSDKIAMQIKFENIGNIFTKAFDKVVITTPNGQIEQVIDKDLAPRQPGFLFNFDTKKDWQVGKYKAKFEFSNRAIINNKGELADSSPNKILETEIDMTQEMIDQIKKDHQNPTKIKTIAKENSSISAFNFAGNQKSEQITTSDKKE